MEAAGLPKPRAVSASLDAAPNPVRILMRLFRQANGLSPRFRPDYEPASPGACPRNVYGLHRGFKVLG